MSKLSVKKTLNQFDADELRALILDIYSKSKEAKELLDFYAEPDLEAKFDAFLKQIQKEIYRFKKRQFRPRILVIRSIFRKFKVFEPGDEYVGRLMAETVITFCQMSHKQWIDDGVVNNFTAFFEDTLEFLKTRCMLAEYEPRFRRVISEIGRNGIYRNPVEMSFSVALSNFMNKED